MQRRCGRSTPITRPWGCTGHCAIGAQCRAGSSVAAPDPPVGLSAATLAAGRQIGGRSLLAPALGAEDRDGIGRGANGMA